MESEEFKKRKRDLYEQDDNNDEIDDKNNSSNGGSSSNYATPIVPTLPPKDFISTITKLSHKYSTSKFEASERFTKYCDDDINATLKYIFDLSLNLMIDPISQTITKWIKEGDIHDQKDDVELDECKEDEEGDGKNNTQLKGIQNHARETFLNLGSHLKAIDNNTTISKDTKDYMKNRVIQMITHSPPPLPKKENIENDEEEEEEESYEYDYERNDATIKSLTIILPMVLELIKIGYTDSNSIMDIILPVVNQLKDNYYIKSKIRSYYLLKETIKMIDMNCNNMSDIFTKLIKNGLKDENRRVRYMSLCLFSRGNEKGLNIFDDDTIKLFTQVLMEMYKDEAALSDVFVEETCLLFNIHKNCNYNVDLLQKRLLDMKDLYIKMMGDKEYRSNFTISEVMSGLEKINELLPSYQWLNQDIHQIILHYYSFFYNMVIKYEITLWDNNKSTEINNCHYRSTFMIAPFIKGSDDVPSLLDTLYKEFIQFMLKESNDWKDRYSMLRYASTISINLKELKQSLLQLDTSLLKPVLLKCASDPNIQVKWALFDFLIMVQKLLSNPLSVNDMGLKDNLPFDYVEIFKVMNQENDVGNCFKHKTFQFLSRDMISTLMRPTKDLKQFKGLLNYKLLNCSYFSSLSDILLYFIESIPNNNHENRKTIFKSLKAFVNLSSNIVPKSTKLRYYHKLMVLWKRIDHPYILQFASKISKILREDFQIYLGYFMKLIFEQMNSNNFILSILISCLNRVGDRAIVYAHALAKFGESVTNSSESLPILKVAFDIFDIHLYNYGDSNIHIQNVQPLLHRLIQSLTLFNPLEYNQIVLVMEVVNSMITLTKSMTEAEIQSILDWYIKSINNIVEDMDNYYYSTYPLIILSTLMDNHPTQSTPMIIKTIIPFLVENINSYSNTESLSRHFEMSGNQMDPIYIKVYFMTDICLNIAYNWKYEYDVSNLDIINPHLIPLFVNILMAHHPSTHQFYILPDQDLYECYLMASMGLFSLVLELEDGIIPYLTISFIDKIIMLAINYSRFPLIRCYYLEFVSVLLGFTSVKSLTSIATPTQMEQLITIYLDNAFDREVIEIDCRLTIMNNVIDKYFNFNTSTSYNHNQYNHLFTKERINKTIGSIDKYIQKLINSEDSATDTITNLIDDTKNKLFRLFSL